VGFTFCWKFDLNGNRTINHKYKCNKRFQKKQSKQRFSNLYWRFSPKIQLANYLNLIEWTNKPEECPGDLESKVCFQTAFSHTSIYWFGLRDNCSYSSERKCRFIVVTFIVFSFQGIGNLPCPQSSKGYLTKEPPHTLLRGHLTLCHNSFPVYSTT